MFVFKKAIFVLVIHVMNGNMVGGWLGLGWQKLPVTQIRQTYCQRSMQNFVAMGITTSSSSDFWSVLYISPQALLQVACLRNFYLSLRYIWLYLNNHFNVSASGINIRVTFMTHMLYTVYISVCATNIYLKSVYRSAFLLTVSFLSAKCECGNFKWHILSRK